MSRPVRLFLFGYTSALILAEAIAYYGQSYSIADSILCWQVPVSYLILAIGAHVRKSGVFELPRRWLFSVLALSLLGTLALCFPVFSGSPTLQEALGIFALSLLYCVLSMAIFSATPQYLQRSGRRWAKVVSIGAAFAGVALILASLVTKTTGALMEESGWKIAMQKANWITSEYNVAQLLPGRLSTWAQSVFAIAGSVIYLLILIGAILIAAWIFKLRGSSRRLGSSRFFLGLAASSTFLNFWLQSDIFWGWQSLQLVPWWSFNRSIRHVVIGFIGFSLWVAAPAFVCWMILHALKRDSGCRILRTVLAVQLPLVGFNFTLAYPLFENDLHLPGLGLLIVGSQVLACASIALLLIAEGQGNPAPRPEGEVPGLVAAGS